MKKLGLVGGMGPESTIPYYHDIVYGVQERVGKDFFKQPFLRRGIQIVTPSDAEMDYVNQKITSELEHGVVRRETLEGFQKIILRMRAEEKIEAIVLGCTELPLLLNDEVSPVPCLDTMQIHIQDIISEILQETDKGGRSYEKL